VFVTRDQLTKLSQEIHSNIKAVEDYQISSNQFSQIFVDDLIKSVSNDGFKSVLFEDALNIISKYSIEFSNDLKPNVIKEEIQNNFKIEKIGDKKHIKLDYDKLTDTLKEKENSNSKSMEVGGSYGLFSANLKSSSTYSENNKDRWINSEKSLDDQLKELNTYNEGKIEFAFKGEKIYPKSLQVAKIQKSMFKKDIVFERIRNEYNEYNSTFSFSLSTKLLKNSPMQNISIDFLIFKNKVNKNLKLILKKMNKKIIVVTESNKKRKG